MQNSYNIDQKAHIPVLLAEVLSGLAVTKGKKYIDATFGFGGHTSAMLKRGAKVLGIERDEETIEEAQKLLTLSTGEKNRLTLVHGNYASLSTIAATHGFGSVDGILFDLGYSSWQLDKSGRGFRFSGNEPLDMRFDRSYQTLTASELINRSSKEKIEEVLTRYAEEEQGGEVAVALLRARPIMTNSDLLKVLDRVFGNGSRRRAARVFQALRIAVNDELALLKTALPQARELLVPGGVLAVISFHSLEDRIIKRYLKTHDETGFRLITKRPITAGQKEIRENARSKSAKLRLATRI